MSLPISLAQWSLHRSIESGRVRRADFPRVAREEFDIDAIELVNQLMEGHDAESIAALKRQAGDCGVRVLLIMCDDEGDLSDLDRAARLTAARNHFKWVDAAAALGAAAIRVNTGGEGRPLDAEAVCRCAEACREIIEFAAPRNIAVLIENHGGLSSRVDRILDLMRAVDHPLFGTLPDFGNFPPGVDRYDAVQQMMPYARAVSAKCLDFDEQSGAETTIDFPRMIAIVRGAGYRGPIGIEYEGERLDEFEGVRRCKALLGRCAGQPLQE
jgi:sugar phosphate isomerase/epimerase